MATYKLIQDIEAEDKLLGPLTLRQFIYAGVAALLLYLSFLSLTKHVIFLLVIFLPPALLAGFLAFPWGRDQPTEVWALAKVRFLIKPHRRIWDQSGVKELVTITAPKTTFEDYTNGLSQTEVRSRLRALADTIDSRGWAIKNANVNLYAQPLPGDVSSTYSDRLVNPNSFPTDVSNVDVQAEDDILDEQNNPTAQLFEQMIKASSRSRRQKITDSLKQAVVVNTQNPTTVRQSPPNDYWFLNQPQHGTQVPDNSAIFKSNVVPPGNDNIQSTANDLSPADELALDEELKSRRMVSDVSYPHIKKILPISQQQATKSSTVPTKKAPTAPPPQMTQAPDPAILNLASNNDWNVATLAREVNRKPPQESPQEVVVSLH